MLGIDVGAPPLPEHETRLEFIERYAEDSGKRLDVLRGTGDDWWKRRRRSSVSSGRGPGDDPAADAHVASSRSSRWRCCGCCDASCTAIDGPTADTGGLPLNHAPTIVRLREPRGAAHGEHAGGAKSPLPGSGRSGGDRTTVVRHGIRGDHGLSHFQYDDGPIVVPIRHVSRSMSRHRACHDEPADLFNRRGPRACTLGQ